MSLALTLMQLAIYSLTVVLLAASFLYLWVAWLAGVVWHGGRAFELRGIRAS